MVMVKSHTNGKSFSEEVNRIVEKMASKAHSLPVPERLRAEKSNPIVSYHGMMISGLIRSTLEIISNEENSGEYWKEKLNPNECKVLLEDNIGKALLKLEKNKQETVRKAILGWRPVLHRTHVDQKVGTNLCPMCRKHKETQSTFTNVVLRKTHLSGKRPREI